MKRDIKGMGWKNPETGKVVEIAYSTQVQSRLERTLSNVGIVLACLLAVSGVIAVLLFLLVTNTGLIGTYLSRAIC